MKVISSYLINYSLTLALSILVIRSFSLEAYGAYGLVAAIAAAVQVVADTGYNYTKPTQGSNLRGWVVAMVKKKSRILYVVLWPALAILSVALSGAPVTMPELLHLAVAMVFLVLSTQASNLYLAYSRNGGMVARAYNVQTLSIAFRFLGVVLLIYADWLSPISLVWLTFFTQLPYVAWMAHVLYVHRETSLDDKSVALLPRWMWLQILLLVIAEQLILLLTAITGGASLVAGYLVLLKFGMVTNLAATIVVEVVFSKFLAPTRNGGTAKILIKGILTYLGVVSIPGVGFLLAPELVFTVLGEQYLLFGESVALAIVTTTLNSLSFLVRNLRSAARHIEESLLASLLPFVLWSLVYLLPLTLGLLEFNPFVAAAVLYACNVPSWATPRPKRQR